MILIRKWKLWEKHINLNKIRKKGFRVPGLIPIAIANIMFVKKNSYCKPPKAHSKMFCISIFPTWDGRREHNNIINYVVVTCLQRWQRLLVSYVIPFMANFHLENSSENEKLSFIIVNNHNWTCSKTQAKLLLTKTLKRMIKKKTVSSILIYLKKDRDKCFMLIML